VPCGPRGRAIFLMNVVGKIFIVAIFALSLVFMAVALMLQAAYPDYRSTVIAKGGLKDQWDAAKKEKQQLVDEKKLLEAKIKDEQDRWVKRLAGLEQEKTDVIKVQEANAKRISDKEASMRDLVKTIESFHESIKSLHAETVAVRSETKAAIDQRRTTFEKVLQVSDDLLNAVTERLRLEKLGRELRAQLSKMAPTARPVAIPNRT
jgi:tRNA U34 5-carboxymethylaminomethyl modifying enzyme MnmG/GidA